MQCPICGGATHISLTKERNVSCCDYFEGRRIFPTTQGPLHLQECAACGFGFFEEMRRWSDTEFKQYIYNAQYELSDPPFREERPRKVADWLGHGLSRIDILDYGGGNGRLTELLNGLGFDATCYDPFYGHPTRPISKFSVITVIEVMEHVPDQNKLFQELEELCQPNGIIILNTLLKEHQLRGDWWYASPRNGHVSFHTSKSLLQHLAVHNLHGVSLSAELHIVSKSERALEAHRSWLPITINAPPPYQFADGWERLVPK